MYRQSHAYIKRTVLVCEQWVTIDSSCLQILQKTRKKINTQIRNTYTKYTFYTRKLTCTSVREVANENKTEPGNFIYINKYKRSVYFSLVHLWNTGKMLKFLFRADFKSVFPISSIFFLTITTLPPTWWLKVLNCTQRVYMLKTIWYWHIKCVSTKMCS